jgi:hypothetical protein
MGQKCKVLIVNKGILILHKAIGSEAKSEKKEEGK